MPTNNYFRSNGPTPKQATYFFFDDSDTQKTTSAHAQALSAAHAMKGHVSMWRPPQMPGKWDECQVIGHRRRISLEAGLEEAMTPEEIRASKEALGMLDAEFSKRRK